MTGTRVTHIQKILRHGEVTKKLAGHSLSTSARPSLGGNHRARRRRGLRCRNVAAGKLGNHAATLWVEVGYACVRRTTNAALRILHRRFAPEMERGSPIGMGQMLALRVAPRQYVRVRMPSSGDVCNTRRNLLQ